MPQFIIVTLGCKVNQYETQSLREAWLAQGLGEAQSPADADCIIVNSCAITSKAVADVRAAIRKLHRSQPQASIIVTGCAAEVMGKELMGIEGVSLVVPRKAKALLLNARKTLEMPPDGSAVADAWLADNITQPDATGKGMGINAVPASHMTTGIRTQTDETLSVSRKSGGDTGLIGDRQLTDGQGIPQSQYPPFSITSYERSRAVLKIQDGCSHCCTYCIVPRARGGSISRPVDEALNEAGRLLEAGFGEIVISGINLRQFRYSRPSPAGTEVPLTISDNSEDFWLFIEELEKRFASAWAGVARFRISSLEPGQITRRAVDVLRASRLIAPHLHLSLQSGSDAVLARMGRGHYRIRDVLDGMEKLQSIWRPLAMGADIISGFPGETAAEHAETLALLERLPLTYAHVFPYSRRPHTIAARLPDQIEAAVKKERAAELRAVAEAKQRRFIDEVAKLPFSTVAVEQVLSKRGKAHGINEWYVDCEFVDDGHALLAASAGSNDAAVLVQARPVKAEGGRLLVRVAS